jgi:hypothetical protein
LHIEVAESEQCTTHPGEQEQIRPDGTASPIENNAACLAIIPLQTGPAGRLAFIAACLAKLW